MPFCYMVGIEYCLKKEKKRLLPSQLPAFPCVLTLPLDDGDLHLALYFVLFTRDVITELRDPFAECSKGYFQHCRVYIREDSKQ